jgi:hypothetical protein
MLAAANINLTGLARENQNSQTIVLADIGNRTVRTLRPNP